MVLRDKVAVVTGSGQGLGKAFAIALAEEGAKVITNDISPKESGCSAEDTADAIKRAGGDAMAIHGDVAQMSTCERLIKAAIDAWGSIDILVNNAGINRDRMIWNMTEQEWDEVINVILKGTFGCTKFAAAQMRQQKRGRIINISSQAGLDGNSGQPNYSAAKSGIVGLTKSCALALAKYGVTVNALCPQADTTLWRNVNPDRAREMGVARGLVTKEAAAKIPDKELYTRIFGSPKDVAPIVVYLASDQAASINGQVFFATGGLVSIYAPSNQIRTIYKNGRWSYEELASLIPASLAG